MKKYYFYFILLFFIYSSCKELTSPIFDCPLWYDPSKTCNPPPKIYHVINAVSPNREKLVFSYNEDHPKILNLKNGLIQSIDFDSYLPENVKYDSFSHCLWCPYDNNRIMFWLSTLTDTIGDGKDYIWGYNWYIMSLDGNEFKKITPSKYGKAASNEGNVGPVNWLNNSSTDEDYFFIGSKYGTYIPQTDEFIPTDQTIGVYSPDNKYFLSFEYYNTEDYLCVINDFMLYINDNSFTYLDHSWSADSKKLVLSVSIKEHNIPFENHRFSEIWIIDVEKVMRERPAVVPVNIINIRRNYCMYSYGLWAEYITDSTLAVSMFRPDEKFSYIYEISEKGEMIRQLTFEP